MTSSMRAGLVALFGVLLFSGCLGDRDEKANTAPEAAFTITPDAGPVPLLVAFDASPSTDSDGRVAGYAWEFGDGGRASGGPDVSHVYESVGTYQATLTVVDDKGSSATARATVTVTEPPNVPPTASFTVEPDEGYAPLTVTVNAAASSDPDGEIVSYWWDFADGTALVSGQLSDHVYSEVGVFAISLTVEDDRGATSIATMTVTVLEPPVHQPVTYHYTTGDQPTGSELAALFLGSSVSGTFDYDSAVLASGIAENPPTAGSTLYAGAMTNLSGSVAGNEFGDPLGRAVVGDEKYTTPDGGRDILVLAGDPGRQPEMPPETFDFSGFEIAGYTLQNVRLFWIEGLLEAGDFLVDQNLPTLLPEFHGRLALDFVVTGTTAPISYVFFDLMTVTVAEGVAVDVQPRDKVNRLSPLSDGTIAVAVLTTDRFDALQVDPLSVRIGPLGAGEFHGLGHVEDVDLDGDMDLVLHFRPCDAGIRCDDASVSLHGRTFDGRAVSGADSITTVDCP